MMTTFRLFLCGLVLQSIGICQAGEMAEPASLADTAATPLVQSQSLALAMAGAVEQSSDCSDMSQRLEAALVAQSDSINAIAASDALDSGTIGEAYQQRLAAMVEKVKSCAGKVNTPMLEMVKSNLAARVERFRSDKKHPARTDAQNILKQTQQPLQLESTSSCKNDCCIKGWQTWAAVTFFSAACLAGDNQACCLATTLASYDACVNTYCPTNNCCADVPPGGP